MTAAEMAAAAEATPAYTPPQTRWVLARPASFERLQEAMCLTGLPAPAAAVLLARGLNVQELEATLRPQLLPTPNAGLVAAARKVLTVLEAGGRIRIHGDYDADGVTATATLVLGLRELIDEVPELRGEVHGFIPHRLKEGYGIHPSKLDEHAAACDLLLTVDCGVSNNQEVAALLERGIEVVITDHHAPGDEFPNCLVVHPHLTEHYDEGWHNLTGAGVSYHLLWAICRELGRPAPEHYLPLATIGTVADVAPLRGENRALVQRGLELMPTTRLAGMQALLTSSAVNDPLTARDVAFGLAPRLNAAGRMGEADLALELLTTSSPQRAQALAEYLETRNNERKDIQNQMFKEALEIADPTQPALVVTKEGWHAGVMGIVASKLLETYYKPVYIMAAGKGSVRSVPGISAVGGLRAADDLLLRYGGHPGAAGFSVDEARFDELNERLQDYVSGFPTPEPTLQLDAPLPPHYAGLELAEALQSFAPFGEGWNAPLWHLRTALEQPRLVGDGKHLQFQAAGLRGIKFHETTLPDVGAHDLALHLRRSEFRGSVRAEWQAEDLRPAAPLSCIGEDEAASSASNGNAKMPRLLRRDPPEVLARLAAAAKGVCIYAEGAVLAKVQAETEGHRFLSADCDLRGEPLVLFALPPAATLQRWLEQAASGPPVTLSWGQKTLQALASAPPPAEAETKAEAEASAASVAAEATSYWRYQWAHAYTTLDNAGFAAAAAGLAGLGSEFAPYKTSD